ncbi:MAG: histidine phosphatase family protein [Ignavibacterium sp.]|jgi:phosphohistidine phosphatase|nr:histidine phosphatase family protein [Ignavibacterium sp.]
MNLYLIRHSIAENISIDKKDFDRELTSEGKTVILNSVKIWKNYIKNIDVILTSPLIRAVQTSEIILSEFNPAQGLIKDNNLGTGSRSSDLIELLNALEYKNIAVIGHQPDLSIHINNFCNSGSLNIFFPPAALAGIEFNGQIKYNSGKLLFFIPPIQV